MSFKLVYGWGINDADYSVYKGRVRCPYFGRWLGMIERSYSAREKERHPTYELVTVNEAWKHFSSFLPWMRRQIWQGLDLDKDILVPGNKEYWPDACAFIPQYINKITNVAQRDTDLILPFGVCIKDPHRSGTNIYVAQCRDYSKGTRYEGRFPSPEQAHQAWQLTKADSIESAIRKYNLEPCFRQDVADALQMRADNLRDDHANNRETFSL